jgi:hypothetical protein
MGISLSVSGGTAGQGNLGKREVSKPCKVTGSEVHTLWRGHLGNGPLRDCSPDLDVAIRERPVYDRRSLRAPLCFQPYPIPL